MRGRPFDETDGRVSCTYLQRLGTVIVFLGLEQCERSDELPFPYGYPRIAV